MRKLLQALQKPFTIGIILLVITSIISTQEIVGGKKSFDGVREYNKYNNYTIFKQSYFHLIEQKDLYALYPDEHWDYYKYSPAFALSMGLIAYLPDGAGLLLWNLLNVFILFFAIRKFPGFNDRQKLFITGFFLIELITSVQNEQSNALLTGLIIFAFHFMEKRNVAAASLCIVSTAFIKLFGIAALVLFIFYPDKVKAALYTIGWTLLLTVLPLIVVSVTQLQFLYESYFNLLQNDHSASYGFSVAGWLHNWFHFDNVKGPVFVSGFVLLLLPLLKLNLYKEEKFRVLYLSFILIWMVIFNHKAESPTFIIAISGVALWFFSQKKNSMNSVLLVLALVFTVLSATDIFPRTIRNNYFVPYVVKAVPCILIWTRIIFQLMMMKQEPGLNGLRD